MSYPKLGVPLSLNDLFPWLTRLPWLLWLPWRPWFPCLPGLQWLSWSMRHALTSDLEKPR